MSPVVRQRWPTSARPQPRLVLAPFAEAEDDRSARGAYRVAHDPVGFAGRPPSRGRTSRIEIVDTPGGVQPGVLELMTAPAGIAAAGCLAGAIVHAEFEALGMEVVAQRLHAARETWPGRARGCRRRRAPSGRPGSRRARCRRSPASRMPLAIIASAVSLNQRLVDVPANVFQVFQPMGGVGAKPENFWASAGEETNSSSPTIRASGCATDFVLGKRIVFIGCDRAGMAGRSAGRGGKCRRAVVELLCLRRSECQPDTCYQAAGGGHHPSSPHRLANAAGGDALATVGRSRLEVWRRASVCRLGDAPQGRPQCATETGTPFGAPGRIHAARSSMWRMN